MAARSAILTDELAWPALLRAGAGRSALCRLVDRHGSASAALDAGPVAWRQAGLAESAIAGLLEPDLPRLEADLDWLRSPRHHLLGWDSPDYPPLLRRIASPPPALWLVGDPDWLWHPQLAIVGSRSPSRGGEDNAAAFAAAFARAGLSVTSGLAQGIDAAAHRAALAAGGATIAVMGTGPDRIYPSANSELAGMIAANGCLLTEHAPGTGPRREHFPSRNRIIAGLGLGTLVVEAATRSGALITARLAGECGREVFAVPGSIHNPLARGCHQLIRQGAALVETAQEVIDALAPVAQELAGALRHRLEGAEARPHQRATAPEADRLPDDPDYRRAWAALGHDPVDLDTLSGATGLTVAALSSMLLLMELEGLVAVEHGRYARRPRPPEAPLPGSGRG